MGFFISIIHSVEPCCFCFHLAIHDEKWRIMEEQWSIPRAMRSFLLLLFFLEDWLDTWSSRALDLRHCCVWFTGSQIGFGLCFLDFSLDPALCGTFWSLRQRVVADLGGYRLRFLVLVLSISAVLIFYTILGSTRFVAFVFFGRFMYVSFSVGLNIFRVLFLCIVIV